MLQAVQNNTSQPARSLTYLVADFLEAEIIVGKLRPRERLIEAELAVHYGVGRAPASEVLRMLEQEGFVSKGPQGLEAADISLQEVSKIFGILAHLDELCTRWAIPHLTPRDLRSLESIPVRMKAVVLANDVALYFASNEEFHCVSHSACRNRQLIRSVAGPRARKSAERAFQTVADVLEHSSSIV